MKTLFRPLALVAVLAVASACQQFYVDTQMTPEKAAASIRLVCDALDSYTVPATNPDNITFNISSNTPWTIVCSNGADWLTVSPSSSAMSSLISDVVVSARPNTEEFDRSATLTVRGENVAVTKVITIKQSRFGKLFITPISEDYSAAGGPLSFTIQTNVPWSVRSSENWLHFNNDGGDPDPEGRAMTITATADPSNVLERTATITITAGDDEESFEVSQIGKFELTELSTPFASEGNTQAIKFRTDLPWSISVDQDWLSFDRENGTGDGSTVTVAATAKPNEGSSREAQVTVSAGGLDKTFTVKQNGFAFEIVTPASTELKREGGELILEVNSAIAWEPATNVPNWTLEKVDASHLKVTAAWNNRFTDKGIVSISGKGGAYAEIELTQPVNFSFEGHYEILEDGSVKVYVDEKTRVSLIDPARYVSFVLAMGEVNFDDKAEFVLSTHDAGGGEMQCQIRLGAGKNRLRTNGGATSYNTADIGITVAELNAMTEYRMDFRPNEDPSKIDLEFFYNGTSKAKMTSTNPYAGDPATAGHYFFGCEDAASGSATWYIVKTCTPTFIAE